jgi:catechol 2,3-dioxygenase-like lactoylglutathione lyase family enzyme
VLPASIETQTRKGPMMKRFHVHVAVDDLDANVRFYSTVFGASPTVLKTDYAKWMLEDPRVNFAISKRGLKTGLDHLGVQVDSDEELAKLREQIGRAEVAALEQKDASCCYARSDKYWTTDPQGIAWETFHTLGDIPVFGENDQRAERDTLACCAPSEKAAACCSAENVAQEPGRSACCG